MTAGPPDPQAKTILLVDDEKAVRSIVLKILRRANYNVIEAESGEEALRIAASHEGRIDLIVSDMNMPGMGGPELVQKLVAAYPGMRALFVSGYADQDLRAGVLAGASFLNKPFSGGQLASAVQAALDAPAIS